MNNSLIAAIKHRVSVNFFDVDKRISIEKIAELVELATRAPTAFNLQNWRFIAVRSVEAKERLRKVAGNQKKISDAAVTFIVCGQMPDYFMVKERLEPSVAAGFMSEALVKGWGESARSLYDAQPHMQRDEAIRTATFGAATLMFAAEAYGLASCPMVGFDPDGVAQKFQLGADEIPVLLLAIGSPASGNWPQKPRRPINHVLDIV